MFPAVFRNVANIERSYDSKKNLLLERSPVQRP